MILADFFALRQARRRLWAACKRICAGLTSILCTSRSGLHASSASAAAARCTAGCTAHRQLTAPSMEQMKVKQGVTEQLKADNQMLWVGKMNNIIACAEEIVVREVVHA